MIRGLDIHDFTEGVDIRGTSTSGNHVEGNFIGTDPSGTRRVGSSLDGIEIFSGASGNTVGGPTPGKRNVISGNEGSGLIVSGNSQGARQPHRHHSKRQRTPRQRRLGHPHRGILFG